MDYAQMLPPRALRTRRRAVPPAPAAPPYHGAMRPQPLVAVRDVEASSRWYQTLLGCASAHGGREYERLVADGRLILQLHNWEVDHHHGPIGDPDLQPYGNGVLLWFEVDDFDAAVQRAGELGAEVVQPPHRNPPAGEPGGPAHREIWVKDLDGYTVVVASPDGEAA
jgi:catechol 2,3-dioxygenase-like lactoylglutathione lyase family enzyme